ncbi:MAG: hypothetical protein V2B19_00045 [Pseudomonadota bacterium]
MKATSYQKDLIESLKDPNEASAYLNAAIESKRGIDQCFFWPCAMSLKRTGV